MARRQRRRQLPEPQTLRIENLSHEGRGIAHINGKTVFVFGALKQELVRIQVVKSNRKYDEAITLEVLEPAPERIKPKCAAFEVCGGCSLQHIDNDAQVAFKQAALLEAMDHAGVKPGQLMPALRSEPWGYRRKARLGVKFVRKKGRLLVGFRERNAPYLADMSQCEVLIPEVGLQLQALAHMIEQLEAKETIPQIEMAADDEHIVLVFRHLEPLCDADRDKLIAFAKLSGFWLQLQPGGPESVVNLYPEQQGMQFSPLRDDDLRIHFSALDFTQVNTQVNQQMVAQALQQMDLQAGDQVLDLFCGLGNFTLPMARLCARVTGVEGDQAMVQRARDNALAQGITNSDYHVADLSQPDLKERWIKQKYDKILLDPPRSGAMEIVQIINRFKANTLVYVSCQPASLVRDSKILCDNGYRLEQLGVMDMFPQTAHVESMAVFRR